MKLKLTLAALLTFVAASGAYAGPKAGDSEIGISAQFMSSDDFDMTIAIGSYGYQFTDAFQILGAVSATFSDDSETGSLTVSGRYHFNTASDTVPYIGIGYGTTIGDVSEGLFTLEGGVKQFLSERTSVNYGLSYQSADDFDFLVASIGLSIYF